MIAAERLHALLPAFVGQRPLILALAAREAVCLYCVQFICAIENFDPMGVHTGDSLTVAPAQALTDKEYQVMRQAALGISREIGVDTGGSNIQFAVHQQTGRLVVIEMNPRVSRSSALAS